MMVTDGEVFSPARGAIRYDETNETEFRLATQRESSSEATGNPGWVRRIGGVRFGRD